MIILRRYFIAGLLLWLPVVATVFIIKFLVDLIDRSLSLLPVAYRPDVILGFHIPGIGVIFTLVCILVTGLLVTNFLGDHLVNFWEKMVNRIPLVRSIYNAVKQVVHTLFNQSGESFRKVLLVEYPRVGMWTIAFQTAGGVAQIEKEVGEELITVFVPTTPIPTSGYIVLVPRHAVKELDISVDEALRMVISLGVVSPNGNNHKTDATASKIEPVTKSPE